MCLFFQELFWNAVSISDNIMQNDTAADEWRIVNEWKANVLTKLGYYPVINPERQKKKS
jgi:hypothetical protein